MLLATRRGAAVHLVLASDDAYACPLTVAARTAVEHLSRPAVVHVVDAGITDESFALLERSLTGDGAEVVRHRLPDDALDGLPVDDHLSSASYARLFIGELLPRDVDRLVYVDADMLVRGDLATVATWRLDGAVLAAAVDERLPTNVDAYPDPERHGLAPSAPYFNAGLLCIDLDAWRREDVGARALELVRREGRAIPFHDQGVLNILLAGRWATLPPTWNQQPSAYRYPSWQASPHGMAAYRKLLVDPDVVHFATGRKPWTRGCIHPFLPEWWAALGTTAWRGWTPDPILPVTGVRAEVGRLKRRLVYRTSLGIVGRAAAHAVRQRLPRRS